MSVERIASPDDPRLKPYGIMRDPELVKRSHRFLAEGRLVVRTLLETKRFEIESVLLTEVALTELQAFVESEAPGVPIYVVSPETLRALGNIRFHQGCLAAAKRPAPRPLAALHAEAPGPLWVGFDAVGNPDNIGAIMRSAYALGVDAALVSRDSCSPLYRKAVRTSMGAALRLPWVHVNTPWSEILQQVKAQGRAVWALTPGDDAIDLDQAIASQPDTPRLLILGAEGVGIGAATRAHADLSVRIPMRRPVDSLNVAAAAAIALHTFDQA